MDYCLIQGQGVLRLHPCTQVDDEQLRSTPGKLDRQAQAYAQHAYAPQPGISPRFAGSISQRPLPSTQLAAYHPRHASWEAALGTVSASRPIGSGIAAI